MLEVMYELPAKSEIKKCIITKNVILKGERPVMMLADGSEAARPGNGADKAESA
jgi:ATP-dependent Clp protease ATP-binding subunit ClpX